MLTIALAGMATGLSLIVAIGAQNAFVLRQGLYRANVPVVVAICALSDVTLIIAGVGGVGTLIEHAPWVLDIVRWLGVAFLLGYGLASLRRALHPGVLAGSPGTTGGRRRVVLQALALTWLNPHVYLDTVLLLGSIAATHGSSGRWWFAAGACLGSVLWFSGLGFGAQRLTPILGTPRAWRILDLLIGVGMIALAATLV